MKTLPSDLSCVISFLSVGAFNAKRIPKPGEPLNDEDVVHTQRITFKAGTPLSDYVVKFHYSGKRASPCGVLRVIADANNDGRGQIVFGEEGALLDDPLVNGNVFSSKFNLADFVTL